ncbi:MAG: amino acid ABC transporter substrate-binding protein [Candidatus Omnitrophica bacterium]|nr:amino acid ABC transporter substrate-binding protein [Candidatus Omnitrophota bacterium]
MSRRIILSAFFIFFVFLSGAKAQSEYSPDIKRIIDRGKLIVAMLEEDNPPFFMHDEKGDFVGLDVDLAHDIAAKLGVEVEFRRKAKTFDAIVDMVFLKEADVAISYLSKTLERAKKVIFTDTYITLYQTVVVNRLEAAQRKWDKDLIKYLNDKNVRIATLKESSYITFAEELFPLATIVPYDIIDVAFDDARSGKVEAAFFDNIFAKGWHHDNPDAALYVQTIICRSNEDPIAMAVHWEDVHLYEWLNQYLDGVIKDGTVDKLVTKYLEGA